jgi:16S rRNA (cytosine967-C5)-methyltransferase
MNPRAAERLAANALDCLRETIRAVGEGRPADQTIFALYRSQPNWGSRDRRFISQLVFSFFRWRGWLAELDLNLAAALAYSLDSNEPHIAQTAIATREMPAWHGLSVAEKMAALGAMIGKTLTHEMLVPDWLPEAVAALSERGYKELVESFQTRPPTWVRACEGHAAEIFAALQVREAAPRRHDKITNAIACEGGVNFQEIRKEIGPVFEVQDIASQAAGLICAPKPGERWLDVCAGSGGKSLHLADLMRDQGEIVATDVRASALEQLAKRAANSGFNIIHPLPRDIEPDGPFDGALVDAPCSGIGTWSRNPDMRWRTTAQNVHRCARQQLEILLHAAGFVKPGCVLVFAVCTIAKEETSDIVENFLAARNDFEPSKFRDPLMAVHPPSSVLTLLPSDGPGDGMFIAKFRKKP